MKVKLLKNVVLDGFERREGSELEVSDELGEGLLDRELAKKAGGRLSAARSGAASPTPTGTPSGTPTGATAPKPRG